MREQLARWIAALTATVTVSLALTFAWIHNRSPTHTEVAAEVPVEGSPLSPLAEAGEAVFRAQRCTACHSIAGAGSPRYPLDGVGARLDAVGLRAWIIGAPEVADELSDSTLRRKQQYQALPVEELDALVAYLHSLRN